ncbi:MATE family efflux transporter [Virgibacillus phasianinus]|uniref:Probable multidrug resistance protein NorM n=1 Tax=Virgibacillus phasianinus TaxID=2017483 RepID=A0A220TZX0_9BACI|nr:MATE family efflux transporter [Virgibacillus phasianinus]ASK61330.1 MATE family efflux transporter [Virgibacillus phasianinus]
MFYNSNDVLPKKNNGTKEKLKIILFLAMPAVIENFFQTILGFVDTLFVSKIGLDAVSAVGVTNAILAVYIAIFMSLGVAVNVWVAKYIGAGENEKAKHIGQQAIVLAIVLGIIFGAVTFFFTTSLLQLMGIEENVLEKAVLYFRIVAIPSVLISLMFVFSSILRGTGDTKTPMKITIGINLLNILLDYALIFGFAFIPSMGIAGAAYATVIARLVGSVALLIYLQKVIGITKANWKVDRKQQWDLITLGSPVGAERLVMRIGQVLYFGFIVVLGTNTFAAHQIAGSIEIFSYMIANGFATAAMVLVGQSLGADNYDDAKQYARLSTLLGIGLMTIVGFLLFFFGGLIGSFFTNNPNVIEQIQVALQIDAFIQPVLAVVLILTGVFNGGSNTKFPMYITTIGIWGVRIIFIYLLAIMLNWGIAGVWIAIGLDNLFRAIFLFVRFSKDNWAKKNEQL